MDLDFPVKIFRELESPNFEGEPQYLDLLMKDQLEK